MGAGSCRRAGRALLWAALCGPAAAGEVTVSLHAQALAEHAAVVLADLATVTASSAELQRQFAQLPLGPAPLAGYQARHSREELALQLRGLALSQGHRIAWEGAPAVTVQRASRLLETEKLVAAARQLLLARFGAAYDSVAVQLAAPLPALAVPAGPLQLRARLPDGVPPRGHMAVWVDVLVHDTVYRSVVLPLAVSARRAVYVARRALAAGATAAAADFELRQEDAAALADEPLAPGALAPGARLRQAVAQGQVLATRQLAAPGMVLRGDRVRLVAQGGAVEVETVACALADGGMGQRVAVRPEGGSAMVEATVVAPDLVRIEGR